MQSIKTVILLTFFLMIFFQGDTHSEDNTDKKLYLNNNFYKKLSKISSIERVEFIAKNKNNFVLGKGKIIFIDKKRRYKRKFRVVLVDQEASKFNLIVRYYIFFNSELSISMLSLNQILEFQGQFMTLTPVNINRNIFIIDIVLEKGSIIIE